MEVILRPQSIKIKEIEVVVSTKEYDSWVGRDEVVNRNFIIKKFCHPKPRYIVLTYSSIPGVEISSEYEDEYGELRTQYHSIDNTDFGKQIIALCEEQHLFD